MPFTEVSDWRRVYRDEARVAYLDMKRRYPTDRIIAFALLTDDDFLSLVPRADAALLAEHRLTENPLNGVFEKMFGRWELLWSTCEWGDIYDEEFPGAPKTGQLQEDTFDVMMAFREQWFAKPGNTEDKFRREMLGTMSEVLRDLDQEGLFGEGADRERITLFLEISDSDLDPLVKLWSAVKLNPPRSRRRLTSCLPWIARAFIHASGWVHFFRHGPLVARPTRN